VGEAYGRLALQNVRGRKSPRSFKNFDSIMPQRKRQRVRRNKRKSRGQPSETKGSRAPIPTANTANPHTTIRYMPLFGLSVRRRLPYFESVAITGSASAVFAYSWSCNGCFDPNVSGTGHQPNGFDEMMKFYNHYTVVRSKCECVIQARNSESIRVALSLSGSTSYSTDYQNIMENGLLVSVPLTYVGAQGSITTLKTSCDLAKFQGMKFVNDDSDMRGDSASNPAEQAYYQVSCWNALTATVPIILADMYIEYDVLFTEPKKAAID
jgi:hypothetical protein